MANHDQWANAEKRFAYQQSLIRGIFAIGSLGVPIVLLGFVTKPLWVPSYLDAHRSTPAQELRRAEYYDEQGGGWVGQFRPQESDRRAKESYETVIHLASQDSLVWQAHNNLGHMNYDEGNFQQAIVHWQEAQLLSDSDWQRSSIEEKLNRANCRIVGGSQAKCLGLAAH